MGKRKAGEKPVKDDDLVVDDPDTPVKGLRSSGETPRAVTKKSRKRIDQGSTHLIVGDGDLSFTVAYLKKHSELKGKVVTSVLEKREDLEKPEAYGVKFTENIAALEAFGIPI